MWVFLGAVVNAALRGHGDTIAKKLDDMAIDHQLDNAERAIAQEHQREANGGVTDTQAAVIDIADHLWRKHQAKQDAKAAERERRLAALSERDR